MSVAESGKKKKMTSYLQLNKSQFGDLPEQTDYNRPK